MSELFKGHQDIEFAVQEDVLSLLQSRPLTGISEAPPFPVVWEDPADAGYTWMRAEGPIGSAGPSYRLQQDAIRIYAEGSRRCFEDTGVPMARDQIVRFFNGYSYARPPVVDADEVSQRQEQHRARDNAYIEKGTSFYEAEIRSQVEQVLAELAQFRPRRASVPALVEHLERTLAAYGHVMGDLHWRMAAGVRLDWPSTYREITGEPEVASGALLQGIPNKTTLLVRRLINLARLAQADRDLSAIFRERSYQRLQEVAFRGQPGVRRFRARFRSLLRGYGLRSGRGFGSGAIFTAPTWNMDPRQPLDLIAAYAQQELSALEKLEANGRKGRRNAERRVRRLLAQDKERLERFDRELPLAIG